MIDTRKIRHIRGDMSDFFQADLLHVSRLVDIPHEITV